ncbi:biotin--[acetyl-CoA-carboxylase] ligase [Dongia sedimenti]|uniref:biotin--[biotin carboxyl-carrier protein] ligase n=1 Tax=Dongia sedimenti TaxID=3064282 RepID=A0ABU0YK58_9PROT|nr:biotin--[acetyl-CoA-carboxylase] ligase [Rhodospirillaceae bacterium R-7]
MTIAFRITEVPSIDSTNAALRQRAAEGEPEGLVLRADEQTAGRGRRGRDWFSPLGNLYVSFLLRPDCRPAQGATLGFVAAVALGRVLRDLTPAEVLHKWPNDLLIDGRKMTGMSLEAGSGPDGKVDWLVLGIGVNILSHPETGLYPTTDLVASGGPSLSPRALLDRFLDVFGPFYDAWVAGGFQVIRSDWLAFAAGVGERVVARLEREEVAGRFADLDPDGALIMQLDSGQQRRIAAGDIFFPNL